VKAKPTKTSSSSSLLKIISIRVGETGLESGYSLKAASAPPRTAAGEDA